MCILDKGYTGPQSIAVEPLLIQPSPKIDISDVTSLSILSKLL